ncbi:hypothetical protein [Apilactobacillus xinyiensis]|nr:hypothetical protein [Apilactobacillus xinyiensis]MCL0330662.1 hypothetical protein [Apilactobacillus xinyiensis]
MTNDHMNIQFHINPSALSKLKKHPDWCKQPERLKRYLAKNIQVIFN